jgi:hypothetical protein
MILAQTRAQLAALRDDGRRQRLEQAQQHQTLSSTLDRLQQQYAQQLTFSLRCNSHMFLYTHAMLQAQTTVVQPYILKKQALLCHALHQTEVLTKQIQVRRLYSDALVIMLEQGQEQIRHCFWKPRLEQWQANIQQVQEELQQYQDRMAILQQQQRVVPLSLWQRDGGYVIIEEDDDNEEDEEHDFDDTLSSSTSSSQSTEQASPSPLMHHQDVIHQVLSMALAAVSEGRLSVFDSMKKSNLTNTTPPSSPTTTATTQEISKPFTAVWDDHVPSRQTC